MPSAGDIERLIEIMAALRSPETGCSWDLAQTHASLAPYALEEAYEVVDAIERGISSDLCDELGDLLFQVVFHSRVAEEAGRFDFADVVAAISEKMIRRHPHIFSDRPSDTSPSWEAIKAAEREARSPPRRTSQLLDDVPVALPGLTRAVKLQTRAASVGFDWDDVRLVLAKIREEIDEVEAELDVERPQEHLAGEIGDLLFALANLARHAGVDPETALRLTNAKFTRRFAYIESRLTAEGSAPEQATLEQMDLLWNDAKHAGL